MIMNRKGPQNNHINGFNTPLTEVNPTSNVLFSGHLETKLSPGATSYRQRSENEPLLPEVPLSISLDAVQDIRCHCNLPISEVNPIKCNGQHFGDSVRGTPSPPLCRQTWFPPKDSPTGASMSDIELAMSDEEGQNRVLHSAPGRMSANRGINTTCSPIDNLKQPMFPVPPKTLCIKQCPDDCCDKGDCDWHTCVLKYPQFIMWQDDVKTITLKKLSNVHFGMSTKIKESGNDQKGEVYVLVDRVLRQSIAAKCGLAVGDMVLSVNGSPLQNLKKYKEVDFKRATELKLQIQRPLQILCKAADVMKNRKKTKTDIPNAKRKEPRSPDQEPVMEKQPYEAIPLLSLIRSDSDIKPALHPALTSHCLPQVRVFLCGNCTLDFVRSVFGNLITVSADSQAFTYQMSMERLPDGGIRIDNSKAFTYMTEGPSNNSINVEVIAIVNDKFFHNFCPWMFTSRSIFLLTFDTRKLSLSNDAELARLSTLANTIISHIPINSENLHLFGMKPPDDDATLEEVRTLFYTSLAASLPEPKIISLSATGDEAISSVQDQLFTHFTQISKRQKVLSIVPRAIDQLIIKLNLIVNSRELQDTLPDWVNGSPDANKLLSCVIEDLKATGNLREVGNGITSQRLRQFLIPSKFFECLASLLQGMEKGQNNWAMSSNFPGVMREMDLSECVAKEAPCPPTIIACMKELGIVFPVQINRRDSGFSEESSFFMPYFLNDQVFHVEADKYQEVLRIDCHNAIPVLGFFRLLSDLSFQECCVVVGIESRTLFRIGLDGAELIVNHDKGTNVIRIFSHRNHIFQGKSWLRDFVENCLSHHVSGSVHCKEITRGRDGTETATPAPPITSNVTLRPKPERCQHTEASINVNHQNFSGFLDQLPPTEDGSSHDDARLVQLREQEQTRLMNIPMVNLIGLHDVKDQLHEHLTVMDKWEVLSVYLGLTTMEVEVYRSLIQNRRALPGNTFLTEYTLQTKCSLGFMLESLIKMSSRDKECHEMALKLWNAAWNNNSGWPPIGS